MALINSYFYLKLSFIISDVLLPTINFPTCDELEDLRGPFSYAASHYVLDKNAVDNIDVLFAPCDLLMSQVKS